MKIKLLSCLLIILFVSACGMPSAVVPTSTPQPLPTETIQPTKFSSPGCISPEPTQDDIDRALSFTGKIFDIGGWERSYSVAETRVAATWLNNQLGSVAYLEALIFHCGYEEIDIENYFDDENWLIIFENYESFELTDECVGKNGLRLYQFDAADQGSDYFIKYWVQPDTDHRVIIMMMTFPFQNIAILEDYSYRLFPTLTMCK